MEISDIYLKDIKVDNYKSLKNSSIEFQEGLNIIIGKNGAGKSNLLEFINKFSAQDLFRIYDQNPYPNFSATVVYNSENKKNALSYNLEKSKRQDIANNHENPYSYELTLNKYENKKLVIENKKIKIKTPGRQKYTKIDLNLLQELEPLQNLERRYIKFEIPENINWLLKPSRFIIDYTDPEYLSANFEGGYSRLSFFRDLEIEIEVEIEVGDELSEEVRGSDKLLRTYLISALNKYLEGNSINSILNNYTPISEIRFNPNLNVYSKEKTITIENFSIEFLIKGDWMPWSYLSDGTKRLFYLISECVTLDTGIILIEEPELGVHPHQLLKILDFLKEQSKTKQVIISTHSPLTLDILKENELDRIIIATLDNGTRFHKLAKKEISKAKRYITEVGELSYYWLHSDLEK